MIYAKYKTGKYMNKNNEDQNHLYRDCILSSACRIMTEKIPITDLSSTVGDVEKMLEREMAKFETINYIYVVDGRDNKLKGVITIKEIFRQRKDKLVRDIMKTELITVRTHTHRKRVAYLALKNNLKAIPVIDKDDNLLGAVSNDTISSIIHNEATEDFLRLAGIHKYNIVLDNIFDLSIFQSFKHRFPWLFIGLLGGIAMSKIINTFEGTIEKNLILAAYIPLVVYMASAVGEQMRIFIVRDFAVNNKFNFNNYFFRHFYVVFLIGILSSVILYILNMFLYGNIEVGFVLSLALLMAILSSVFTGLLIPFLFERIKIDPANASGPIATIIQDTLSVVIYFLIASWML